MIAIQGTTRTGKIKTTMFCFLLFVSMSLCL